MPDRFATMLTCIDGRIQQPLAEWASRYLGVEYVDTITEPGPDAALVRPGTGGLAQLLEKVEVSRRAHDSATLVVAAHSDCAGNPVSDAEHRAQLQRGVTRLAGLLPGTRILAVHVGRCGERCWDPELIADVSP